MGMDIHRRYPSPYPKIKRILESYPSPLHPRNNSIHPHYKWSGFLRISISVDNFAIPNPTAVNVIDRSHHMAGVFLLATLSLKYFLVN